MMRLISPIVQSSGEISYTKSLGQNPDQRPARSTESIHEGVFRIRHFQTRFGIALTPFAWNVKPCLPLLPLIQMARASFRT